MSNKYVEILGERLNCVENIRLSMYNVIRQWNKWKMIRNGTRGATTIQIISGQMRVEK